MNAQGIQKDLEGWLWGDLLWAEAICFGREDAVTPTMAALGQDVPDLASLGEKERERKKNCH